MKKGIQQAWIEGTCPIRNGIFFADGTFIPVVVTQSGKQLPSVRMLPRVSMAELETQATLEWTYLAQLCELEVKGFTISGGEGGMGSDGFVAVTKTHSNEVVWLAFFETSNPFERISAEGEVVKAISNLGVSWNFPLQEPEKLFVSTE